MRDLDREIRLVIGRFGGARARPLTLRQQQRLARAAQAGNKQAGAKLVESCFGLVVSVATEHASGETVADMVQNGAVEMLERLYGRPNKRDPEREVTRYDPDRGVKFWTFARPYVIAAIRDTFERPQAVPLPEDEYDVPQSLRQDDPLEELLKEEREREIERAYARAREAVHALPDPDRPMFLLRHGVEGEAVKRLHALELVGVSGREGKTALQRAGRTLARDGRVRTLKRLLAYESAQDLRTLRDRSEALYVLVGPAPLWRPPVPYNDNRREQPPVARVILEGPYNPYRKHPGTFGGEVSPPAGEQIDPDILTQPPTWMPNPDPGPWDVGTKKVDPREYGTWVRVAYPETPYSRGVRDVLMPPHVKIRTPVDGVLPLPTPPGAMTPREGVDLLLAMSRAGDAARKHRGRARKNRKRGVSEPEANP